MKTNELKVRDIVNELKVALNCNQQDICDFTGISTSALNNNIDQNIEDIENKKTGRHLSNLLFVVSIFYKKGLSSDLMKTLLGMNIFPNMEGYKDSIISSIHQDLYSKNVLSVIADKAYKQWQSNLSLRNDVFKTVIEKYNISSGNVDKAI